MQNPAAPARPSRDELEAVGRKAAARYPESVTAYVAGSLVEGYGNGQSDLDLFVLFAGAPPAAGDGGAAAAFDGAGV
jgi:predicted nucleotidyltransferase